MKVRIFEDEDFRLYIDNYIGCCKKTIEIPDELYEEYVKIYSQAEEIQKKLYEEVEKQNVKL